MKEFTVKVTSIATLTVEAKSEDEAIDKACEKAWEYDADEKTGEILEVATMPEKTWKLGEDLVTSDSLLDGLTFDDLILAVHCNCRSITPEAVRAELKEVLESRKQDMMFLLEKNMGAIMAEARKGRE